MPIQVCVADTIKGVHYKAGEFLPRPVAEELRKSRPVLDAMKRARKVVETPDEGLDIAFADLKEHVLALEARIAELESNSGVQPQARRRRGGE